MGIVFGRYPAIGVQLTASFDVMNATNFEALVSAQNWARNDGNTTFVYDISEYEDAIEAKMNSDLCSISGLTGVCRSGEFGYADLFELTANSGSSTANVEFIIGDAAGVSVGEAVQDLWELLINTAGSDLQVKGGIWDYVQTVDLGDDLSFLLSFDGAVSKAAYDAATNPTTQIKTDFEGVLNTTQLACLSFTSQGATTINDDWQWSVEGDLTNCGTRTEAVAAYEAMHDALFDLTSTVYTEGAIMNTWTPADSTGSSPASALSPTFGVLAASLVALYATQA